MYHYKLSPNEIADMTEEQTEMLLHGLVWLNIIKFKPLIEPVNMEAWGRLGQLIIK